MRGKLIGIVRSAETRARISAALRGKRRPPRSAEHCAKLSAALRGRTASAETRAKLSVAKRGRKLSAEHRAKISAGRLARTDLGRHGPANPKWKGGRRRAKGYITILSPGHPNAAKNGYVPEHVLVMSGILGRPMAKHETVHHINGVKDDNRPENLQLMTRAEHASHHHKGLMKPASLANLRCRQQRSQQS